MAYPSLTLNLMQEAVNAVCEHGSMSRAADKLGIARSTLQNRIAAARRAGLVPWDGSAQRTVAEETCRHDMMAKVKSALRKEPMTLDRLAHKLDTTRGNVLDAIDQLKNGGVNVHAFGDLFSIEAEPAPQHARSAGLPEYRSRDDNTYLFGFTSDNHIGSKYERLDVLHDLYDQFEAQGVDRVFNAGNWIDGEARFNKFDLKIHGMDRQLAYMAAEYPQRSGIMTYAVAGDDHEGWYCQREGVDIGAYAELKMRQAGRNDFVNLGYMEAFVRLVNANSGQETKLLVCHPGGGSAYAISYTSQKSVEAFEGGEKPAVALFGHYHKLMYACIRNVHTIQTGCTEDQTPFMRKRKLSAHVGGGICQLRQDPATGAIIGCRVEFFNYFNQGFYNQRWSMAGDVAMPERSRLRTRS